jgi:hypothetical protein
MSLYYRISSMGPIRIKAIRVFFTLTFLEGLIAFIILLSTHSLEKTNVVLDYSLARILLIVLMLALLIILAPLTWLGLASRSWIERCVQRLDTFMLFRENLIPTITSLLLPLITIFIFQLYSYLSRSAMAGQIQVFSQRGLPFLAWVTIVLIQTLAALVIGYPESIRQKDWRCAWVRFLKNIASVPGFIWVMSGISILVFIVLFAYSPVHAGKTPVHDLGIFLYFGSRIDAGAIPYRDLWDHKPPLVFYIDALGLFLSNNSIWGVWVLEFISALSGGLLAYRLLKPNLGLWPALFALVGFTLALPVILEGGNLTEEYAIPFQFFGLFCFLFFNKSGKHIWPAVFCGWAFIMAMMLKQTMIGIWLAIGGYILLRKILDKRVMPWKFILWAGLGALTTLVAWILYFAFNHALWDFWDVAFRYNFLYSDISSGERLQAVGEIMQVLTTSTGFFVLAGLAWLTTLFWVVSKRSLQIPDLLLICLIDVPVEIILITVSGKNYLHYMMSLLLSFTLLNGYLIYYLTRAFKIMKKAVVSWALLSLLIIFSTYQGIESVIKAYRQSPEVSVAQAVQYIESNTVRGDTVLLWGSQTVINFLSNRAAPTRYVHQKPLFRPGYASQAISDELLRDIKTKQPKLIINTFLPSTPFPRLDAAGDCIRSTQTLPDGVPAIFDYICQNYKLIDRLGKDRWEVLSLR